MVFFTCNGCGESMKKAQVEKHVAICRNCQCFSCIDCGKDFWGNDYTTHLKCVTEDEKYGGKGFSAKVAKGEVKQQQWIQSIQEAMKKPNITDDIRKILMQITTFDNVPRKKAKFKNWIKNSMRISNEALQDKVWDIFAEATSKQKDEDNKNSAPEPTPASESKSEPSAATEETEQKKSKRERKEERQKKNKKEKKDLNSEEQQNGTKRKGKKRKTDDDEGNESGDDEANAEKATGKKKIKKQREREDEDVSENEEEESPKKKKKHNDPEGDRQEEEAEEDVADENGEEAGGRRGKFNWKGTIKALLRLAPDNELPIKKLRKKVIAQYYMISSEQHKHEKDLFATFNKKIQKNPKFRVLKEKVKLLK